MFTDRRSVLNGLAALPILNVGARGAASSSSRRPAISVTIDDFHLTDTPLLDAEERDRRIRRALGRHHIRAAGFVAGKYIEHPRSDRVLSAWSSEGHILGNHSFSHRYFSGRHPDAMIEDVLKCEPLLSSYASFQKLFRFPYLAEGSSAEGRDRMRALLKAHGYRNGHVTIDTSDWYIDDRLVKRLSVDPHADITPYRRYWLNHIWERATFYDGLARRLFGHPIEHTILLHHRLATALFLDPMLEMFRKRGWRLISAAEAFATQVFSLEPDSLPAGQSLVWAAAKANGGFENLLRYPGEDGKYEQARMDALGL